MQQIKAPKLYFIQISKPCGLKIEAVHNDGLEKTLQQANVWLESIIANESEEIALKTEIRIATNDLDMFPYLPAEDNITVAFKEAGELEIK